MGVTVSCPPPAQAPEAVSSARGEFLPSIFLREAGPLKLLEAKRSAFSLSLEDLDDDDLDDDDDE